MVPPRLILGDEPVHVAAHTSKSYRKTSRVHKRILAMLALGMMAWQALYDPMGMWHERPFSGTLWSLVAALILSMLSCLSAARLHTIRRHEIEKYNQTATRLRELADEITHQRQKVEGIASNHQKKNDEAANTYARVQGLRTFGFSTREVSDALGQLSFPIGKSGVYPFQGTSYKLISVEPPPPTDDGQTAQAAYPSPGQEQ